MTDNSSIDRERLADLIVRMTRAFAEGQSDQEVATIVAEGMTDNPQAAKQLLKLADQLARMFSAKAALRSRIDADRTR